MNDDCVPPCHVSRTVGCLVYGCGPLTPVRGRQAKIREGAISECRSTENPKNSSVERDDARRVYREYCMDRLGARIESKDGYVLMEWHAFVAARDVDPVDEGTTVVRLMRTRLGPLPCEHLLFHYQGIQATATFPQIPWNSK